MSDRPTEHYYGDSTRKVFIIAGLIMLFTFPFFSELIGLPLPITFLAVIALAVFGGILNPRQYWIILSDAIISVVGLFVFEYTAASAYINLSFSVTKNVWFFWTSQILAILFFLGTYLSFKTLRGAWTRGEGWLRRK